MSVTLNPNIPQTASFAAKPGNLYPVNATSASITVTLPPLTTLVGNPAILIYRTDATANTVTVSATISGVASPTLTQWQQILIWSDGTNYIGKIQ